MKGTTKLLAVAFAEPEIDGERSTTGITDEEEMKSDDAKEEEAKGEEEEGGGNERGSGGGGGEGRGGGEGHRSSGVTEVDVAGEET